MLASIAILLLLSGYFELPSIYSLSTPAPLVAGSRFPTALDYIDSRERSPFTSLLTTFSAWDTTVRCPHICAKLSAEPDANADTTTASFTSITSGAGWSGARCEELKARHIGVLVKGWTWIPDTLDGVYTCRFGVNCVWSKSTAVVDHPDSLHFKGATPSQHVGNLKNCSHGLMQQD